MESNEVYLLLGIVEKLTGHGTSFQYIRGAAIARLEEIDAELNPNKPEPAEEGEPEEVVDNPATGEDREEVKDGA